MVKYYEIEELFDGDWVCFDQNQFGTIEEAREHIKNYEGQIADARIVEVIRTEVK